MLRLLLVLLRLKISRQTLAVEHSPWTTMSRLGSLPVAVVLSNALAAGSRSQIAVSRPMFR
ncbi:hypothetical protein [Streptomyces tropicalis]|uniref:Secreted protein n=1 Tax=Streptomyces tropicalis TaxID=3034234 RepID=A0ABT6AEN3_9ACTN|nr:hypothetical protein [Streptomyces tropicalis]MDF3303115.1 hypothetical protein [Streptomyces tropicalis]